MSISMPVEVLKRLLEANKNGELNRKGYANTLLPETTPSLLGLSDEGMPTAAPSISNIPLASGVELPQPTEPRLSPYERTVEAMGGTSYQRRGLGGILGDIGKGALTSFALGGLPAAAAGAVAGGLGMYRKQAFDEQFKNRLQGEQLTDESQRLQADTERRGRIEDRQLRDLERKEVGDQARDAARIEANRIRRTAAEGRNTFLTGLLGVKRGQLDQGKIAQLRGMSKQLRQEIFDAERTGVDPAELAVMRQQLDQIDNYVIDASGAPQLQIDTSDLDLRRNEASKNMGGYVVDQGVANRIVEGANQQPADMDIMYPRKGKGGDGRGSGGGSGRGSKKEKFDPTKWRKVTRKVMDDDGNLTTETYFEPIEPQLQQNRSVNGFKF